MRKLFVFLAVLLLSFPAYPEIIQLKSGRTIKGEIVERGADYIRLDFQGITLTYYLDEIETIDGKPPSEEKESLSISPVSPYASQLDRTELKKRLKAQLEELHYPEHTHPALKEELIAFFERINLPALQSKAQLAKDDPDKLKELAQEIRAIFEREGFLDTQSPRPLIRLLVDSFGDDDMLSVIEQSPLSQEEKEARKSGLYACSVLSQLGGITLDLLGLPVKTLESSNSLSDIGHVANYIPFDNREIFLIDFLYQYFEIIDLEYWYQKEGEYLTIKPQHCLSFEQIVEIGKEWEQELLISAIKELLNFSFSSINLRSYYSASSIICFNRGFAYGIKGNFSQAIFEFNQALAINPNYAEVYSNRGAVYYKKGDFTQAIADFNQSLRINPNLADTYYNRGNAYAQKGDLNQAISDYNQALAINPNDAGTYVNRAIAYTLQGNYTRAWEDVRRAQELGYPVPQELISELRRASERER